MNKFRPGDRVRNVGEDCLCCGMEGTFIRYWADQRGGELLTLRNACDVAYSGMVGPYGYPYVAQSADDLEKVVEDDQG
jgi:hypothetical protein